MQQQQQLAQPLSPGPNPSPNFGRATAAAARPSMITALKPARPRHFLAYDPLLSFWEQPRLLRGVFGIIIVSTLVSIFEIGFTRLIVLPETEAAIGKFLDTVDLGFTLSPSNPASVLDSFLEASAASEGKLIKDYNDALFVINACFVAAVAFIGFLVYQKLATIEKYRKHVVQIFGVPFGVTFATSLLSILGLCAFQVNFFLFATKFQYVNNYAEIEKAFLDKLDSILPKSKRPNNQT